MVEKNEACEVIVAQFVWGVQRCGNPAAGTTTDPTWDTEHPVCAEHLALSNR